MLTYQISLRMRLDDSSNEMTETCSAPRHRQRKIHEEEIDPDWKLFNQRMTHNAIDASISIFVYQEREEVVHLIAISRQHHLTQNLAKDLMDGTLHTTGVRPPMYQMLDFRETTLADCYSALLQAEGNDLLRVGFRFYNDIGFGTVKDHLEEARRSEDSLMDEHLPTVQFQKKEDALTHIRQILGHHTLREEMARIYHNSNYKDFLEHPVHYLIHALSRDAAQEMIDALVAGLYANGRLLSKRINYFHTFDGSSSHERLTRGLLNASDYAVAAVEIPGILSRALRPPRLGVNTAEVPRFWLKEIAKHRHHTLFILVKIGKEDCAVYKDFVQDLSHTMDIIHLYEGRGNEKETKSYLNHWSTTKNVPAFDTDDLQALVPAGTYTPTAAMEIFDRLCKMRLHRDFYPAYKNVNTHDIELEKPTTNGTISPTQQLSQMVGLNEVKSLVDRIIAAHKMKSIRQVLNMKGSRASLHMMFTGNPGCAKTTVARLIGGILKEEQIVSTGTFIECGRGDLVGKYVGWTAKNIQQKFHEAAGGILFIDEAYSLADDSNSFGMEAINTIVQEMENLRDDVIVIFAGYPDKMEDFINRNEGLKSRIAFHLKFPDYNPEELIDILCNMAKERGLRLNPGILRKCRRIFIEAVKTNNFGNGRYVRNLLDAAVMRQAERLTKSAKRQKITRQKAACLTMDDFMPIPILKKETKPSIGFQVCKSCNIVQDE